MVVYIISAISMLTTFIGLYFVSEKNKSGFIFYTISLGCQLYLFLIQENWFLVSQMVVLILSNLYVYIKWSKGEK